MQNNEFMNKQMDRQIKNALYMQADTYTPPTDLKQRIDEQIARQKKEVVFMRKMSVKKVAVAAAAMCVLTGTVCMAGGKISGYIGGNRVGARTEAYSNLGKLEQELDLTSYAPESFDNGYAFAYADISDFDAVDEDQVTVKTESELDVTYEDNSGNNVFYTVKKGATTFSDEELAHAQAIVQDGVTYYYIADNYLFLPPDGEPTEEDLAAEKAGTLMISYGSSEREEKEYDSLWWNVDGQSYSLSGFDVHMDAQELMHMAEQTR